jgi:hypothetical protein
MAPESDLLPPPITPTHVWALIPLEYQQHVVQLLAHLAVHLIAAQPLCQRADLSAKERNDVHPSSPNQDPV